MKLTNEQLRRIIKEELQAVMGEEMGESLKQKVMSNIDKGIQDGGYIVKKLYDDPKANPLEVRKYVKLLSAIKNSGYDDDFLTNPEYSPWGMWADIFGQAEDQKWYDGYKEVDIRFTDEEVTSMCPDCGPVWQKVVDQNDDGKREIHHFEESERSDVEKDRMDET